jgi:GPH family glycoside/pentoside/hexuronide:cation symporter
MSESPSNDHPVPISTAIMLAYVLPKIPIFLLLGPLTILPGIYAKYFGLSLTTLASIIFLARIFDTVTDPAIGYCSDWYNARTGSRKPFMIVGGIILLVSGYFLFVPVNPDILVLQEANQSSITTSVSATYFLLCIFAFYLAMTLFEIPHLAWACELTTNAQERNKLFGLRSFAVVIGQLMFFTVPLLGIFETSEFTPHTLQWSVLAASISLLPLLYISVTTVPNCKIQTRSLQAHKHNTLTVKKSLLVLTANKPFLLLVAAMVSFNFAAGMWAALLFIFVDSHLKWGHHLPISYSLSYGLSALSIWVWYRLANHMGKKLAIAIGMLLSLVGILSTAILSSELNWVILALSMTLFFGGAACLDVIDSSLLADIIDYGTWKFGHDQTATYFAMKKMITKVSLAMGGALSLAIAGWSGFEVTNNVNGEEAIRGLYLAIAWLPAPFILIALVFVGLVPINDRRHRIIRLRLDAKRTRANIASSRNLSSSTLLQSQQTLASPQPVIQGMKL